MSRLELLPVNVSKLAQTRLGGRVICEERDLLYEEAPDAYKNIEAVIQDLVDAGQPVVSHVALCPSLHFIGPNVDRLLS